MARFRSLNIFQKMILLLLTAMLVVFACVYGRAASQVGYEYKDEIFLPSYETGKTVYSGRLYDSDCSFTVTEDKVVSFRCEDRFYGPYTALEVPSVIPEEYALSSNAYGVELRENGKLLFRGAVLADQSSGFLLIAENGELYGLSFVVTMSDGTQVDGNGNPVDPWEPGVYTILELMGGPELTKKGEWFMYFLAVFASLLTAVSILFADELFRLHFVFSVRDWDRLEPSDIEIACRYIGWTILPIGILTLYLMGLH